MNRDIVLDGLWKKVGSIYFYFVSKVENVLDVDGIIGIKGIIIESRMYKGPGIKIEIDY
jgi:hypothetical protein